MSKRQTIVLSMGGIPVASSKELTKLITYAGSRGVEIKGYTYISRYIRDYGVYSQVLPMWPLPFSKEADQIPVCITISKVEQV